MATNIINIQEIYGIIISEVVRNPNEWISFLNCAGRNYKYDFTDQVLIYAQRPNATACAETKLWNNRFNRWVKKNTQGIALFDNTKRSGLRYVFDVNDTTNNLGQKLILWEVKKDNKNDIIDDLEANFGELANKESFEKAIFSAIQNSIEDNIQDYYEKLLDNLSDSNLDGFDKDVLQEEYKQLLTNSIAFLVFSRIGENPFEFIKSDDFYFIQNFNTFNTITILGATVSDIGENILRNIERTVRNLQKNQNRTFEDKSYNEYNLEKKDERSNEYEEIGDNLHRKGRIFDSKYSSTSSKESGRKIRSNENEILDGERQNNIPVIENAEQIERTFDGNTGTSSSENRELDRTDEEKRENNGRIKSNRPDEMGGLNEQYQDESRGDSNQRSDIQLNSSRMYIEKKYSSDIDLLKNQYIDDILLNIDTLNVSRKDIRDYFKEHLSSEERTKYIENAFKDIYTEIVVDDVRLASKPYQNCLLMLKGSFGNREQEIYYDWELVARYINGLILIDRFYDKNEFQEVGDNIPTFSFTQNLIDEVLRGGSNFEESKYRIYSQFTQSLSTDENIKFLKNEYGIGGSSPIIIGTGVWEDHNAKGILLQKGYEDDSPKKMLSWKDVEQRLKEIIMLDQYLNEEEKSKYEDWLNKDVNEVEDNSFNDFSKNEKVEYEYHLGDKVFIGLDEYEILSFDDNNVVLYDPQFPLLNKEMPRDEFDKKVQENYANNHLIVKKDEEAIDKEDRLKQIKSALISICLYGYNEVINSSEFKWVSSRDTISSLKNEYKELSGEDFNENEYLPKYNDVNEGAKNEKITNDEEQQIDNELLNNISKKSSANNKMQDFVLNPEIPEKDRNNYIIKNNDLGIGLPSEKIQRNIEAIKILKLCEDEQRLATLEEQEVLAQYVGWGGLPQVFEEKNTYYNELKSLLSEEEYENAKASTLTAFYTPPIVIKSIYQALEKMGVQKANILEPSCRNR